MGIASWTRSEEEDPWWRAILPGPEVAAAPLRNTSRVLLTLLLVRGDETHCGCPRFQQNSCIEEIQNAHNRFTNFKLKDAYLHIHILKA